MSKTKHLVITGANRGIGLALAEYYKAEGWYITAIVRSSSPALSAIADCIIDDIDLTDDIDSIANQLIDSSIDLLIHVAGIMEWESLDELNALNIRRQIEVNALAPLLLTQRVKANLNSNSKVVFLTSRLGSITDNTSGKGYGYRMSKAALNMAAKTLSVDLKSFGIAVGLLHPGSVKTSLNKLGGEIEVSEAVTGLSHQIDALNIASTGKFIHQNGQSLAW